MIGFLVFLPLLSRATAQETSQTQLEVFLVLEVDLEIQVEFQVESFEQYGWNVKYYLFYAFILSPLSLRYFFLFWIL